MAFIVSLTLQQLLLASACEKDRHYLCRAAASGSGELGLDDMREDACDLTLCRCLKSMISGPLQVGPTVRTECSSLIDRRMHLQSDLNKFDDYFRYQIVEQRFNEA